MADYYVGYGEDYVRITGELMGTAGIRDVVRPEWNVVIKPNLVLDKSADMGATTHPEIVEGIILFLREQCGVRSITVAEGSWVGTGTASAFQECGYDALCEKYGVTLVDTKRDKTVGMEAHGYTIDVCETFVRADYFINVPVLKGHCQTGLTCCLKNLKGCIPDHEKRRFHSDGLHEPIAALNCVLKPNLHIIDSICGDLVFEEGGNPVCANRILLGFDPVLLDSVCAGLIGYYADEIAHLRIAREWGVGNYAGQHPDFVEIGTGVYPSAPPPRGNVARRLSMFVEEDGACSPCYAALMYALNITGGRTLWGEKLKIGQGFRDKSRGGIGVGDCCSGCESFVRGCPPRALDIVEFMNLL